MRLGLALASRPSLGKPLSARLWPLLPAVKVRRRPLSPRPQFGCHLGRGCSHLRVRQLANQDPHQASFRLAGDAAVTLASLANRRHHELPQSRGILADQHNCSASCC